MAAVPSIGRASAVQPHPVEPRPAAPEADLTRDLYERHGRQIFNYCFHQLGNREEAEDATQTTFLNAFRGLQRGVVPELETAWLFKIANNVILTRRRSSFRRRRVETPGDLDALQDVLPSPQRDADELLRLTDALAGMPAQQRRALLLREWQGLSYHEIAEELDLSQSAVETLLFRARRSLADGLENPERATTRSRLRSGLDLGSLLGLLKGLLGGSAAVKAAATAAVVASSAVVATDPALHHRSHPPVQTERPAAAVDRAPAEAGTAFAAPVVATMALRATRASAAPAPAKPRRERLVRRTAVPVGELPVAPVTAVAVVPETAPAPPVAEQPQTTPVAETPPPAQESPKTAAMLPNVAHPGDRKPESHGTPTPPPKDDRGDADRRDTVGKHDGGGKDKAPKGGVHSDVDPRLSIPLGVKKPIVVPVLPPVDLTPLPTTTHANGTGDDEKPKKTEPAPPPAVVPESPPAAASAPIPPPVVEATPQQPTPVRPPDDRGNGGERPKSDGGHGNGHDRK